jgi:hypothetical protein
VAAPRTLRVISVISVAACALGLAGPATQARTPVQARSAAAIKGRETGVHFTANTIEIPRATVSHNLIGISKSGVFKFRSAAGALARLKPGKVMFLQGSDALVVTRVSHSHGRLLVSTKPASLPQLIKSGKLTFSGAPNFAKAFIGPTIQGSAPKAAFDAPSYPYVDGTPRARKASGTLSVRGSAGAFGYSLAFTPNGAGRLDVVGTVCFQWGSICSTGPSNGLALTATISGYIDIGGDSASISVNGGRITNSTITLSHLKAHLKLTYTASRGTGPDAGGDPPTFHLPIGIDYTVPGLVPVYFKVQLAVLVKLGLSSQNSVLRGGVDYDQSGSDTISSSGKSTSGSGSGTNPAGNILDHSNGGTGQSIALGAGGVVFAVQFPKIGLGLGIRALNMIGYLDMITSMGQTYGGGLIGGGCTYDFAWSEGGGFEAQAGPFLLASPRKILFPTSGKQFTHSFSAPGC